MQRQFSTNLTLNDKNVDGVLGTRTWGDKMEGVDWLIEPFRIASPYADNVVAGLV